MKNQMKRLTLSCLSGIVALSMTVPVMADDYDPYDYIYNNNQSTQTQQQPQQSQQQYSYQQNTPQQNYGYQPQGGGYHTTQNNYQQQPMQPLQPAQNYTQVPQPQNYNNVPVQNNYSLPPLQGRVVTVPPGTMIQGATSTRELSSKNLRTGDRISVVMNTPFYYAGSMVLPAGSSIMGTVVMAEKAGRAEKNGKLMIVFNQAVTPMGQQIGLSGKLATDDGSGILKGGTGMSRTKEVVKDAAIGAGSGALLGTVFGAISGGSAGKGAAIGTAIGGGTGVAKTLLDKGKDVVIKAGERLQIILDGEMRAGGQAPQQPQQPLPSLTPDYNYNY